MININSVRVYLYYFYFDTLMYGLIIDYLEIVVQLNPNGL